MLKFTVWHFTIRVGGISCIITEALMNTLTIWSSYVVPSVTVASSRSALKCAHWARIITASFTCTTFGPLFIWCTSRVSIIWRSWWTLWQLNAFIGIVADKSFFALTFFWQSANQWADWLKSNWWSLHKISDPHG